MKQINTHFLAVLLATCISYNTIAQTDNVNIIKINPASLVVGSATLFYERQVSDDASFQIGINFMPVPNKIFGPAFSCFGITPECRIYLSSRSIEVPGGGYIAPFCRYRNLSMEIQGPDKNSLGNYSNIIVEDDQFAIGFVLGYQYITEKDYVFDFFAGPFSNSNYFHTSAGQPLNVDLGFLGNNGLGFRIGVAMGLAF